MFLRHYTIQLALSDLMHAKVTYYNFNLSNLGYHHVPINLWICSDATVIHSTPCNSFIWCHSFDVIHMMSFIWCHSFDVIHLSFLHNIHYLKIDLGINSIDQCFFCISFVVWCKILMVQLINGSNMFVLLCRYPFAVIRSK